MVIKGFECPKHAQILAKTMGAPLTNTILPKLPDHPAFPQREVFCPHEKKNMEDSLVSTQPASLIGKIIADVIVA